MRAFRRPPVALVVLAGLAFLLTGCIGKPAADTTPHTTYPSTSTPSAAPSESTPSPDPSPTAPYRVDDVDSAPWGITVVPNQWLVGNYTNYRYPVQLPEDSGPIQHAEGTPILERSNVVAYKVAPDDDFTYIAQRFHLENNGYILILNEIRRGDSAKLYVGDILNLSAYTLHKYGSVNGQVADGPEPIEAPPQEP